MLDISRFLQRFAGVPGQPARAGVPVDRRAALEAELAPLFAELENAQRDSDEIVTRAKAESERLNATVIEERSTIVAEARARAAGEQTRVADARVAEAQTERRAIAETSKAEAERIDRIARDRIPAAIEDLVTRVLQASPQ
jgi:vacuolar-type H+-ATPase subunit H